MNMPAQGTEQWLQQREHTLLVWIRDVTQLTKDGRRQAEWLCACGTKKVLPVGRVKGGYVRSCGCLRLAESVRVHSKHGKKSSRVYGIWASMKGRCQNPNNKDFSKYGGRGIVICEKWQEFSGFFEDMGEPGDGMSLDRIDNNLGYFKENCRWANRSQQQRNKSNSRTWSIKGREFLTLKDAATHYGVTIQTIRKWVYGWRDARRNKINEPRGDCYANYKYKAR